MKKKFGKYVKERNDADLAIALLDAGVDVDEWVHYVTDVVTNYELSEAQLYSVIIEGLAGLGGGAMGAMSGMGDTAKNLWSGLKTGVQGAGKWLGQKAAPAMQGAKTGYAKSEIKSAVDKIQNLRNVLVNSHVAEPDTINQFINGVAQQLQAWHQSVDAVAQGNQAVSSSQAYTAGGGI